MLNLLRRIKVIIEHKSIDSDLFHWDDCLNIHHLKQEHTSGYLDNSGTIVVFTSLALMLLLLIVGMALEYSRIQHIQSMIVSSGQAAVLSAAKLYPERCGADFFTACICPPPPNTLIVHPSFLETYKYVFKQNVTSNDPKNINHHESDLSVSATCTRSASNIDYDFYVVGRAEISTIFLSLFGYSSHVITYRVHAHRRD